MSLLQHIPTIETIVLRLQEIFPEGTTDRGYVTREMAAKTIYVMFYAGAIEGTGHWLAPKHVYFMTEEQAQKLSVEERLDWLQRSRAAGYRPAGTRWYADTTREPIRDETLRYGLVPKGAVIEKPGVATTSSAGRYALESAFAELFLDQDPATLTEKIQTWQESHLSSRALARLQLLRRGAASGSERVPVQFPNGEIKLMAVGPSTDITKAVIEDFANRFLKNPCVLWVSESGEKVRNDELATQINFRIDASRNLPDIILVDLGESDADMRAIFVEVVATDGPINELRKEALRQIGNAAGYEDEHLSYLTAFADRGAAVYRKLAGSIAWGTFVWFMSEPDNLMILRDGDPKPISSF